MQQKYLQSFGRTKSRKLRDNANRLMADVLPKYLIAHPALDAGSPETPHQVRGVLGGYKEVWLEIGFGDGGHLLQQALANPQTGFIGCEPFINGTAKLLRGIEENSLKNIRISGADFRLLVEGFPDSVIDRAFILFPDPWPKKRHNKRRLVSAETLDLLARILKPGAHLRIATDHEDYAKWIALRLLNHDKFRWLAQSKADWQEQPADHFETKYQQKNLAGSKRPIFFEAVCDKKLD